MTLFFLPVNLPTSLCPTLASFPGLIAGQAWNEASPTLSDHAEPISKDHCQECIMKLKAS